MDDSSVIKEIIDFCDENNLDSYYKLSTYAYEHEKTNWIEVLERKNTRMVIAAYLKDKHKSNRSKYKATRYEAMHENITAKAEYYSKREKAFPEAIENSVMNED